MKTATQQHEGLDALAKKGTSIEFFSAYQDMDVERMLSLCNPLGEIFFEPLGDAGKGKIYETGKGLWAALMESFPDIDNTVHSQTYEETKNQVSCKVTIFGKHEKDFAGIPAKGLRFDSDHIFIFRFDDHGKIDKIDVTWDHASFVKQLTGS
jgi:hypothetical protein